MTGKFVRHSPEYYEWRIQDRLEKLNKDPDSLPLLDDLGVAYDKLGQHERALDIARRAEALDPDRYETVANLGTFLIHAGQLQEGLAYIRRAIEINPDAHFGREIVQQHLVEYVLLVRKLSTTEGTLPMQVQLERAFREVVDPGLEDLQYYSLSHRPVGLGPRGFAAYATLPLEGAEEAFLTQEEALTGVLGMMRFGNYRSPILLEALGDLLVAQGDLRLAARAYLRAADEVESEEAKAAFRELAEGSLRRQTLHMGTHRNLSLAQVNSFLNTEQAKAESWFARLREQELSWIAAGEDVDQLFQEKYAKEPAALASPSGWATSMAAFLHVLFIGLILFAIAFGILSLLRAIGKGLNRLKT